MSKIFVDADKLEALFLNVESDYQLRKYSGRGMYGKECLGIVADSPTFLFELGWACGEVTAREYSDAADFAEDFREAISGSVKMDNMGLSTIYYFPSIEVQGEFSND